MSMPPMLGYNIYGTLGTGQTPFVRIMNGRQKTDIYPGSSADNSYWIAILDANNPATKVQEFVVPGTNNTAVPAGLDTYMGNPAYLFALATQSLLNYCVPQGDFYDYLTAHGAGRALQRLEALNMYKACGSSTPVSYILTGQGGPANSGSPAYEDGKIYDPALLVMSLMPQANGQPPYSLCDSYTFVTR